MKLHGIVDETTEERAHGRTTEGAIEQLRSLIVGGTLEAGRRIPERLITERTGLTRTPLREALKVLAAEGLVRLEPNRGAVVAALSVAEIEATLFVLGGLEAMAAEPCCARIDAADLTAITALHEELVAHHAAGALMPYFAVNQRLHQAIVDGAGNPVLSRLYATESRRIHRYRFAGNLNPVRWAEAVREHEDALRALTARNGPLLREILRAHLGNGWRVARAVLQPELAEAPSPPPRRRRGTPAP